MLVTTAAHFLVIVTAGTPLQKLHWQQCNSSCWSLQRFTFCLLLLQVGPAETEGYFLEGVVNVGIVHQNCLA